MKDFEVIGLGALNVDRFYRVERILGDGESVTRGVALYPGGSAANTIHGLARLGVRTGFIGAVGDDADGKVLRRAFQRVGVDTTQVQVKPHAPTGSVLCLSDEMGRRSLYVTPGANNLLTAGDIDLPYLKNTQILHLATFVDNRQFELSVELAQKLPRGVKLSFSPGALYTARGLKSISPILKRTAVLFINRQELEQLTGQGPEAGVRTCQKEGCRMVVVTLGGGMRLGLMDAVSYIRDASRAYMIEATPATKPRRTDTTGAGDAFAAGFLFGLLKAKPVDVCGRLGDLVAQFSITRMGARQGLPTLSQLSERYQRIYGQSL